MGRRVRHIRSVPPIAEVFYEVTGKEPQPRPMGEEHGLVVFSYLPDSPVNYFRLVTKHCFLSFRGNCLLFFPAVAAWPPPRRIALRSSSRSW